MEEGKLPELAKGNRIVNWTPFIVGLVVALILGWWVLPSLMKAEMNQPVEFNHAVHVEGFGLDCSVCHYLQDDGVFVGLPTTADCATCHMTVIGGSTEERRFISEFVKTGREIRTEWLVYQKQPDNVFFSHAVHNFDNCNYCHGYYAETKDLCNVCHPDVSSSKPPVYRENRLSGYSEHTMIMWECEACHAIPEHRDLTRASTACLVCHK